MGRRRQTELESCLGCAVTEPAPIGAAQPEYSGQPKGWYGESKMKKLILSTRTSPELAHSLPSAQPPKPIRSEFPLPPLMQLREECATPNSMES
uniref:Uncharacterized protein n=1 Tax=Fagus sylvatica TaxID=28930 RepID=A0A2N9ED61_FAGSY